MTNGAPTDNDPLTTTNSPTRFQDQAIVLTWLARLRWLAVGGQLTAAGVAWWGLGLAYPRWAVIGVVLVTFLSNLGLIGWMRWRAVPPGGVAAVLMLDVLLLTALLYFTGGPENPFSILYLVHIAMSVVAVGESWRWVIVGLSVACYSALYAAHLPLEIGEPRVLAAGRWVALVLVSVLIGYFIGRVTQALRRRERELAAARERAARNEQLAALTTLAAGAAHELGTPLATIAVVAKELELAVQRCGDAGGDLADDARLIRGQVERCHGILQRMRAEVAGEGTETAAAPLGEVLDGVRAELAAGDRQRLVIRCELADRQRLRSARAVQQALNVMLYNALQASAAPAPVVLSVERAEERIRFVVRDSGCGMDEAVLRRAGEPFFTTKPAGRGMGLGLFLARLVAERLGGTLRLSSQAGQGTQCVLEAPWTRLIAAGEPDEVSCGG